MVTAMVAAALGHGERSPALLESGPAGWLTAGPLAGWPPARGRLGPEPRPLEI